MLKGFVSYLAVATPGAIEEHPTKETIYAYLLTFSAIWLRFTGKSLDPQVRQQLHAYSRSKEFLDKYPLSSACRPRNCADSVDIALLLYEIWSDKTFFRCNKYRLQIGYLLCLSTITCQRPGALTVSQPYMRNPDSLTFGDHKVVISPNPDGTCSLSITVTFRLLKGYRTDDSKYASVILYQDPDPPLDPVSMFMGIAFQNKAFMDVQSPEELVWPCNTPSAKFHLRWKPEFEKIPVFHALQYSDDEGWHLSRTKGLTVNSYREVLGRVSKMAAPYLY
jgi:hypothetical protein